MEKNWEKEYKDLLESFHNLERSSVSHKSADETFGLGIFLGYLAGAFIIGLLLYALHDPQTCLITSNTNILILAVGLVGIPFLLFWLVTRKKV